MMRMLMRKMGMDTYKEAGKDDDDEDDEEQQCNGDEEGGKR